ncbi:hypothetical protein CN540_20320 [Bacillus toyonensis]|uniref:hypothetical protein n=1 Tax=Bacillus toyonensis TaxID=155322 RepID=UPI000BEFC5E3|nr:hypothetical protein [Bacillus toyonensis]PEN53268.1 hypothetical protein CN540_20320 [Bacillus toyonensis]
MEKLGDVLLQPETGWSRFDDINTNIFYTGDWLVSTNSPATYNNSVHMKAYPKTTPYRIKFTFTGTGLRLMAQKTSVTEFKGLKTNVVIDGVDSGTFEMYDSSVSTVYQCIMFEELNLEPGPHTVIISTDALYFDAVDVQGGSIFTPKVDQVLTEPESGWTRIDDTNENITYIGQTWTPRTSLTGYYKDTYTNRSSNATDEGTVQFYFKGTGIRIISPRYQSQRPDMNVQIDGVPYGSYKIWDSKVNNLKGQIVAHEVLGLEDRVHEIKLTGTTHMVVDAFDILGGTIVARAKVGDVLTQPEPGWERINNSDPLIKYNKFVPITGVPSTQQCYLNDYHYTSGDGTVTLQFTGTGFNVLGITNIAYSNNISIEIDGVKETFSEKYEVGPYLRGSTLVYQKLNLENKSHTVKIYNSDVSKPLGFDAFDILGGNIEKPPAKVGDPLLQPELGWKRIDDTDSNLQYEGPWKTDLQSIYYNGTVHYGIDEGLKCSFKFKGTTFRFIGIRKSYYRNKAIIKIDGTEYDLAQVYPQPPVGSEQRFQTLVFEKLDLQNTVHSVELYGNDIMIDAFDIDADGSIEKLPAKVGDQLLQPESGWKRIDDTDASFKYVGNSWKSGITAGDEWFNSTFHYIDGGSGEVAFRFSGTRLRIIGCLQEPQYRSNDIKIIIDGNQEMYSEQSDKICYQTLVYEKLGLAEGVHDVVIKSGTTSQFPLTLDAIDIDEKGSISKPTVKVGDQLRQPEPGWKRIDDTDSNIQYGGVWATESKSTHYNSTLHYKHDSSNPTDTNPSTIKFDFEGTKLRIIGLVATSSYDTNATIIIDGKSEVINFRGDTLKTQTLVYEKLNLPSGVHSVEIQGIYLNLDAIDIDSEGSIKKPNVKVGDILLQPELGWTRVDDANPLISYKGESWNLGTGDRASNYYNKTNNFRTVESPGSLQFFFKGTGIRIVSTLYNNVSAWTDVSVEIDGVAVGKYAQADGNLSAATYVALLFEKTGLNDGVHKIKLSGTKMNMDAFDILCGDIVKGPVQVGDELKQPESGWRRIDDTNQNIKYNGLWSTATSDFYYNKTIHYRSGTDIASCRFVFTGKRFRLFGSSKGYFVANAILRIDDTEYDLTKLFPQADENIHQTIIFEALNLTEGSHVVELVGSDLIFDCIDIDENGLIKTPPVKVGEQLSQPEAGWKRLDNTEPNFKYRGTWYQGASAQWYNGTYHYVKDNDSLGAVEFDFYGTQLRIISCFDVSAYRSDDVSITIDGVTEKYSEIASANIGQVLAYEKLGLTKGKHRVRIQCGTKGTYRLNFDAIDIDLDGYIEWPPYKIDDIVTSPEPGWKRFDDNTSEILYDANWDKNVAYPGAYGGKSTRAHKGKNSSFRFKFKGTKFRLIVGSSTTEFYSDKISVRIDDLPLEFFDANAPADTNQVLKYEKLGLEDKEHEVKVKVETSRPGALSYDYRFDALDIDDTGSLIKINTIGNVLTEPEKGWKRIDDNDPLIRYIGNWKLTTGNDKHYNKTTHYNLDKTLDTSFEFEFVGTKLRLLAYGDSGYDATSKVLIDGKEETMVYNSPSGNQVIRYEKIGLDRGKHTVKVIGKAMSLDSIDIDADGYLLARLGDKLVEPEPGWVRFDDTHKNIEYNGFWKTTEGDVSCYNNTHHWKSKEDNNDSTISARFLFKGTKFRLISMTSPSYPEDIELKIDGKKEILKLSGEDLQYQTLAYEKKNLEDMIHVIELSGKYISIDAIDLEEGATLLKLPDEKLKPYQIRSGLIFKDDFDTFDSRWIASPVGSYSLIDRKGYFRMLHNVSRDTLLLADLPNEKEFAFEVSADYTPTHEDDKGGIIVWKNGEENIEFLETEDGTRETTELKWMACKDNEDWTFFSDYGEGFNFYDSDRMNCSKFGVVLKKGSNSKFVNLDIDSIIATRGRKLTIANIAPNISVQMEDEFGGIIFNGNTGYNTGIQITLPSLEFTGKVILTNVEGKELGVIKTTFYGGDVYGFGSNLEIKFSGEELSTLAQTRLPDMISGKSEIMLELVNPSVARANNVNLSIAQYEDKFGWSWADLALDSNGKPGQYQDSINIPYVNPENTIKFWLKVTKGTDYVGLAPLQFQIHLEHE